MDEDLVVGMVPVDVPLESFDFSVPLGAVRSTFEPVFRRRSSLKKGIVKCGSAVEAQNLLKISCPSKCSHWWDFVLKLGKLVAYLGHGRGCQDWDLKRVLE